MNYSILNRLVLLSLAFGIGFGCAKSGVKALSEGEYVEAVMQATDKLRRDGNHTKSLTVLKEAYPAALSDLKRAIQVSEQSNQPFRHEVALNHFERLNQMFRAIQSCAACRRVITPEDFSSQSQVARELAVSERYDTAVQLLTSGEKIPARQAVDHLERISALMPGYRDVASLTDKAYWIASTHVVLEQPRLNSRLFSFSHAFFQDQIAEFVQSNRRMNRFVQFHSPQQAEATQLQPDQVVRLEFVDFVVGETHRTTEKVRVTSSDSVKTGEATIGGKKVAVYGKVHADLIKNRKEVISKGLLQMQILDFKTGRPLQVQEFPGQFVWVNDWASFNGDERALTKEMLSMTQRREELPPPPQQLFIEFCKPIYNQVTSRIRGFYDRY